LIAADRAMSRATFDLAEGEPCLAVFGGSLGARSLNLVAVEAFAGTDGMSVIHISGRRDFENQAICGQDPRRPPHGGRVA